MTITETIPPTSQPPATAVQLQPPSLVSALALSLVRHGLTVVGGLVIAKGFGTADQVGAIETDIIGIAAVVLSMAWSALTHSNATKQAASLITTISNLTGGA